MNSKTTEILKQFRYTIKHPYEPALEWKKVHPHYKVIGFLPLYFPEEIIHASGNFPVGIWGNDEPISKADARIQSFYCGPARTIVEQAMNGDFAGIDGIVAQDTCLAVRQLSDLLPRVLPNPVWFYGMYMPVTVTKKISRSFAAESMNNFKFALEGFTGDTVPRERLAQSIKLFNQQRRLMRKLYALRRTNPTILPAKDFYAIVTTSNLLPREQHISMVETVLADLEATSASKNSHVKIVLAGDLCEPINHALLDILDESGIVIVDDDLDVGARRFAIEISEKGDPLDALIDGHMTGLPPCPTKINPNEDWATSISVKVKKSGAQGLIHIVCRECEPHYFSVPPVLEKMKAESIPQMTWEGEPGAAMVGQLRTRVQAFLEVLKN